MKLVPTIKSYLFLLILGHSELANVFRNQILNHPKFITKKKKKKKKNRHFRIYDEKYVAPF